MTLKNVSPFSAPTANRVPVGRNASENVNCIPAFGTAKTSPAPYALNRASDIDSTASQALERAKASTSYGIFHIYYGLILPLIERVVDLTPEQGKKLDLYRTHMILCDQVDKVKSAFKAYRAAQTTADNTPMEPALLRKEIRKEAQEAGARLMESYDSLIELAIRKADVHQFDKKAYLEDIQGELGKEIRDYILQFRVRYPVERVALDFYTYDPLYLQGRFRAFVTDFVSHVHAANSALGGNANLEEISTVFIRGLATIPEIADELTLIYDSLNDQEIVKNIQVIQLEKIKDHFAVQLTDLMNKTKDITPEDLKSIHCCGVALLSVLPSLSIDKLNGIKHSRKAAAALKQAQDKLDQFRRDYAVETDYSFKDVKAFFDEISRNMKPSLVTEDLDEKPVIGRLGKAIEEKRVLIEKLFKHKEKKQKERSEQVLAEAAAIRACEAACDAAITKANTEVARLSNEIFKQRETVLRLKKELIALEIEYDREKGVLLNPDMPLFKELIPALTQIYEDKKNKKEAEIKAHEEQIVKYCQACKTQKETLDQEKGKRLQLVQESKDSFSNAQKMFDAIDEQIQKIETSSMIRLSRNDIAVIADHLSVKAPVSPKSCIAKKLNQTEEGPTYEDLAGDVFLARMRSDDLAKRQSAQQLEDPAFIAYEDGTFDVDEKELFGEEDGGIQGRIKAQIEVNLAIAREVTLSVIEEVAGQDDEFYKSQQLPQKEMTHQQLRATQMISPLKAAGKRPSNAELLKSTIKDRVQELSGSVISASAHSPVIPAPVQKTVQDGVLTKSQAVLDDLVTEGYEVADKSGMHSFHLQIGD